MAVSHTIMMADLLTYVVLLLALGLWYLWSWYGRR